MKDAISFSVPGCGSIRELQLGYTLIRFADFDLKYFREECAQIYAQHLSAGEDVLAKALAFKEFIRNCHPYCAALMNTEFDKIALDCIIDTICAKEGIGLEELWVRNIASRDALSRALFDRVTEYKTGHAINQWKNLMRLQAYTASKMAVIYGGPEADLSVHKARKLYYDAAFRLTAAELGFGTDDLPSVKISSVPFLAESMSMMKNAVNTLAPAVKAKTSELAPKEPLRGKPCVQDQMAGMALNIMLDMKRPEIEEIRQFIQTYGELPNTVYEPSSFKAIIDLEFDQLMDRGFYIRADQKGYTRAKYSARKEPVPEIFAIQPDPAEPAAAESTPAAEPEPEDEIQPAVETKPKTEKKPKAEKKPALKETEEASEKKQDDEKIPKAEEKKAETTPADNIKEIMAGMGIGQSVPVRQIIKMAEDPTRKASKKRTLQEVNTRCNLIWTSMNVRAGWSITAEESAEWFRYLAQLRYGIGTGELTPEALDKFLDATLEVYKLLPGNA